MNKVCMKTVFAILALFPYVRNQVLETDPVPREVFLTEGLKNPVIYDPDEIYEQNKHLFCANSEEEDHAEEIMEGAQRMLIQYATDKFIFKFYEQYDNDTSLYFKKCKGDKYVGKIYTKIHHPNKYNEIVKTLWDPNGEKKYNPDFVSGKVVRAYNPNLLMIQQRYRNGFMGRHKYLYAFAAKYEMPNNTTIIVKASANINDHNRDRKNSENLLVRSANSYEFDADPDEEITAGRLSNMVVDLSGYVIVKKKDHVVIIHVDSTHDNHPASCKWYKLSKKAERLGYVTDLRDYIDNKYTYYPKLGAVSYTF
ncbi:fam-a protein [Plasmodium vinckei brucechwatti]|uniref:Fam-a protein n=1 Tax=Plasmodium vinckei brucechwatti TaxID=119398 RepID=A0A6V7RU60_PLAVN|nr:fam-a protein [Plasmodium vinckei brucechwatti]